VGERRKKDNAKKGAKFLEEFKDFIFFLQSLWGILAGISVLFPLSNVLIGVIPLRPYYDYIVALEFFSPELITAITTLISLFIVFWTFGHRQKFKTNRRRRLIRRKAFLSFAIGLLALILYLILHFGIFELLYGPWEIWSGDPRRLIGDILLLITYSSFFALVTRAFMLLGMIEYYKQD
jgi:hypothetical protein